MSQNLTNSFLTIILATSLAGIGVAIYLARTVLSKPSGDEKMQAVAKAILAGANAYLKRQFATIAPILIILAILLYFAPVEFTHELNRQG